MIFKNKKASSILMMIMELIVVVTIAFSTYSIAKQFSSSDSIKKGYYADDMAMMVDTLVGMPGDGKVQYPDDLSNFVFSLSNEDGEIKVFLKGEEQKEAVWERRNIHLPEKASLPGVEGASLAKYSASGYAKNAKNVCISKRSTINKVIITLEPCSNE